MQVEVIYALRSEQNLLRLEVAEGSSIQSVIEQSGILERYPEIDISKLKVGIFSRLADLSHVVREDDRIEIYRPLVIDPMEARRLRAPIRRKKHSSVKS
jgi:putative ubiquitin-RnfH superfamily antitoxin RatB of RatAB toxin-antitoxin module